MPPIDYESPAAHRETARHARHQALDEAIAKAKMAAAASRATSWTAESALLDLADELERLKDLTPKERPR